MSAIELTDTLCPLLSGFQEIHFYTPNTVSLRHLKFLGSVRQRLVVGCSRIIGPAGEAS